jgi:6-phosphofructokinase 2
MGNRLLKLLDAENVPVEACRIDGETGYSLAVTDEETEEQFRFTLPGAVVSERDAQRIVDQISGTLAGEEYVVLSGGIPDGLADTYPQDVQATVARRNGRLVVDTSKAPLLRLIKAPVAPLDVLRLDRGEMEKVVGHRIRSISENLTCSEQLVRRGVAKIVVTGHGAEGSAMVAGHQRFFCHAPKVTVRSKIGAGDALVGALALSLSRGDGPEQALKWGVAAAAATVSTEGTTFCDLSETKALLPQCRLESC